MNTETKTVKPQTQQATKPKKFLEFNEEYAKKYIEKFSDEDKLRFFRMLLTEDFVEDYLEETYEERKEKVELKENI